ncbi:MAG: hypothetical protein PHH35_00030 [Candidatus Pacebacteria bacterium]|jgi:Tfp pilus assembly protein PilO|nr:hypothetical protein [Candidatus Paceibacterota bacterium]
MRETSKQNLAILFITIIVTATIFFFIRFIQPAITEFKELSAMIKREKEKILLLKEYKAKSESLIQAYLSLGDQVNDIYLALPDNSQAAQLVSILDVIFVGNEIPLSYLSFTETNQEGQNYIDIKTNFFATYEGFKNWVKEIEKELRLIDLIRVRIEESSDQKSVLKRFDVEMRAYFFNNNQAEAI